MANEKKVFSAIDAAPAVLYAKQVADSQFAYPVIANTNGQLIISGSLDIPTHDYIGLTYTGSNISIVTYKTGGSSGTVVTTLTLAYDGSNNLTSVTKT
jgi:hypothetical protein